MQRGENSLYLLVYIKSALEFDFYRYSVHGTIAPIFVISSSFDHNIRFNCTGSIYNGGTVGPCIYHN